MNILFLRGFNNYFNRVVKKYSTLDDYRGESSSYLDLGNINFNPNDGVATELIVGSENQIENAKPLDWENIGTPDYAVCYEMVESNPVIISRWFVLESERTRTGQYRLALKRDVVAEHFDQIKTAPCFIEKGMINDISNPLLYNKESMTYNQIKYAEYPLRDITNSGWIVGYIPKNEPDNTDVENLPTISTTILLEGDPPEYYDSAELPFVVNPSTTYTYKGLDPDKYIMTILPVGVAGKYQSSGTRYYNVTQYGECLYYKKNSNIISSYPFNTSLQMTGDSFWNSRSWSSSNVDYTVYQALSNFKYFIAGSFTNNMCNISQVIAPPFDTEGNFSYYNNYDFSLEVEL